MHRLATVPISDWTKDELKRLAELAEHEKDEWDKMETIILSELAARYGN